MRLSRANEKTPGAAGTSTLGRTHPLAVQPAIGWVKTHPAKPTRRATKRAPPWRVRPLWTVGLDPPYAASVRCTAHLSSFIAVQVVCKPRQRFRTNQTNSLLNQSHHSAGMRLALVPSRMYTRWNTNMSATVLPQSGWTLEEWQAAYRNGLAVDTALRHVLARCSASDVAWISLATPEQIAIQLHQLQVRLAAVVGIVASCLCMAFRLPSKTISMWPVFSSTAACPEFAFEPKKSTPRLSSSSPMPARLCWAKPILISLLPASTARVRRMARCPMCLIRAISAVVPARARPRSWRAGWCRLRWAPIPPVRAACLQALTISSA